MAKEIMQTQEIQLDSELKTLLNDEFSKDYMINLKNFLVNELSQNKVIFPQGKEIFAALNQTPFSKVKVVIIGQDPYHGPDQAHGLSFSVRPHIKIPPSLKNIYKEIGNDLGLTMPNHGYLEHWAQQGVLLLNSVLTVEKGKAGSHRNRGWEVFTDKVVELLNHKRENLVFLLWGRDAQKKGEKISTEKHLVLKSAHPSPFSVTGFFGQKHFSRTNEFLENNNVQGINWQVPPIS